MKDVICWPGTQSGKTSKGKLLNLVLWIPLARSPSTGSGSLKPSDPPASPERERPACHCKARAGRWRAGPSKKDFSVQIIRSFKRCLGRPFREKISTHIFSLKGFPIVPMRIHRDACIAGLSNDH
jgi:hypothetical protein